MLRSRGCCFATRNLTSRRVARVLLLLERAGDADAGVLLARQSVDLFGEARRRQSATMKGLAIRRVMRNGQNKRMRGRNNHHRKNHNPMARVFESNGPDVKIRGNPSHIAEKYIQLARDAQTSGDPIAAENYYQHAEHYFRVIAAAQEQFRQNNPHFARDQNEMQGARDDGFDDGDDDGQDRAVRAIHPMARASRSLTSRAMHNPFRSSSNTSLNAPSTATRPPKAMSSGCRPSSPAGNSRSSISLTRPAAEPERPREPARPFPAAPPPPAASRPASRHSGRR